MKASIITVACVAIVATTVASCTLSKGAPAWTYERGNADRAGPTQWGDAYPTCAGTRQSPIDISDVQDSDRESPLHLLGSCENYNVTQLYDAYKTNVQGGSCAVQVFNKVFRFTQVHVHAPSEHTIDGAAYDAEAHFVHTAADGSVVVLGVLMLRSDDGTAATNSSTDPFFTRLFATLDEVDEDVPVQATLGSFHVAVQELLLSGRVFNYVGGLTVPPCDEVVSWWVLETPLIISDRDYAAITGSLQRIEATAEDGSNARPTQRLHGRKVTAFGL